MFLCFLYVRTRILIKTATCFIDFSEKRNGFLKFLRFLQFRTRIIIKSATLQSMLMNNAMVFQRYDLQ